MSTHDVRAGVHACTHARTHAPTSTESAPRVARQFRGRRRAVRSPTRRAPTCTHPTSSAAARTRCTHALAHRRRSRPRAPTRRTLRRGNRLPCAVGVCRVHDGVCACTRLASMRDNPRAMTTVGVQHARQHALTSRPRAYASMSIVNNVRDVAAVRTGTRTDWRRGNCNVMSRRRRRALRARRHKPASTWVAQQF